jgi:hypothetical protein
MKHRMHMEFNDGTKDHVDLSGETLKEIRRKAVVEIEKRRPADWWSEKVVDA